MALALRINLTAPSPGSLYLSHTKGMLTCRDNRAICGAGNHPETRVYWEGRIQDNTGPVNLKVTLALNWGENQQ